MTPNEYAILRMFADKDRATAREVGQRLRNSLGYSTYLCAGMVNAGLLSESVDDSDGRAVRAYRLTPKARDILTDLLRGMAGNLKRRAARFRLVGAVVGKRAAGLAEMARSLEASGEQAPTTGKKITESQ